MVPIQIETFGGAAYNLGLIKYQKNLNNKGEYVSWKGLFVGVVALYSIVNKIGIALIKIFHPRIFQFSILAILKKDIIENSSDICHRFKSRRVQDISFHNYCT